MSLSAAHVAELLASGIDPAVATERGYCTMEVDQRDALLAARFPRWAAGPDTSYPALFLPMYRATGEMGSAQLKPAFPAAHPSGKAMKYVSPINAPNVLDVHPRNQALVRDPMVPLWITEGVKKGDALTSRGRCVVTLSGVFNWRSKMGTLGDWEDVPLKGRQVIICFDSDARGNDNVLAAMRRLGAWLTSRGALEVLYLVVPGEVGGVPVKGVDDYFVAGGTVDGLNDGVTRVPPVNSVPADPSFTDAYLAQSVADDCLEGSWLYSPGLGGWQRWDGRRWVRAGMEGVVDEIRRYAVREHGTALLAYAQDTGSSRLKRHVDGWRTVLARTKLAAVEYLCRGILLKDATLFDNDPDVLNVANGVVDLTTGRLLDPDPDRLLTKLAPTEYRPGAEHADWKQALEALPPGTHDWFQVRMGQAITGHTPPDDKLVLLTGGGENGKSTVTIAMAKALGDYYLLVPHKTLLVSADAHTTEMMTFKGARLALMEETPEEKRLNATRLKNAVGTPQITARYIRQDEVTYDTTHSFFISTNFPPMVDETDHGTWRRLVRIDFPYTWLSPGQKAKPGQVVRPGDRDLRPRLIEGDDGRREAVLAWLVNGARAWYGSQKAMPLEPAEVLRATQEWRASSDRLTAFLMDRVEQAEGWWITSKDMLDSVNGWLKDAGHATWSDQTLASRMRGNDYLYTEKKVIKTSNGRRSERPGWSTDNGSVTARVWTNVKFKGTGQ